MPLAAGSRLGAYEVIALIGVGGMGQVYRARDIRLERDVALKILPEIFTSDPDRLVRFQREARVLASLNHPNIAAIYGLEEDDGVRALVLELVEGPTLADRVAQGAIPVGEALPIAKQIAEALEAAHDVGIIHRDLKPANIKTQPQGVAKVLDFGIAKILARGAADPTVTDSPTSSMQATRAGMILGTPAYMSPEQARGQAVDKRTDIWAFGCVLYEMLTGHRAFEPSSTLATALRSEPDWTRLPGNTPPWLRILIERCLEEDRRHRVADIAAAQFVVTEGPKFFEPNVRYSDPPLPVTRFSVMLPKGQQFTENGLRVIAISRDGTRMVYVANRRLYLRSMAEVVATPILGSEVEEGFLLDPVFSPDGQSIAFWTGTDPNACILKKISVTGGSPVTICQTAAPLGMSWDAVGILFGHLDGILRVAGTGGQPERLVGVEDGIAWRPQMLPSGDAVLFTLADRSVFSGGTEGWDSARIVVHSLKTSERTILPQIGTDASYVPTGHVVYVSGGTLFAVPFDASRRQVTGGPVPVVEGIRRPRMVGFSAGTAYYSASDTGSLMFVGGRRSIATVEEDLAFVDGNGNVERLQFQSGQYRFPRVSPDGKHLAVEVGDVRNANIWIYDLAGTASPQQLTFGGRNRFPVWSNDGECLLFQSDREGDVAIFTQRANGSHTPDRLTKPEKGVAHVPLSWSRDGKTVLFDANLVSGGATAPLHSHSLSMFSMADRRVEPFGDVQSSAGPTHAVLSPDDRWVAYVFLEPQLGPSVYVQSLPPTGAKRLVRKGAFAPMWSPTGDELFVGGHPDVFRVERVTRTQSGFTLGNPTDRPRRGFIPRLEARNFDIMPDGRIIGVVNARETRPSALRATQIQVVLNWFEELKRLAPTR